jgi:hypothetical protein
MKTAITTLAYCLLPAILGLMSCQHRYYAPPLLQTPLLKEKHDAEFLIGVGTSSETSTIDISAVYSPIKYGVASLSYFSGSGSSNTTGSTAKGSGFLVGGALGCYYPLQTGTATALLGYSQGNVFNRYGNNATSRLYFKKISLQGSLAYRISVFRLGLGIRFSQLRYTKGEVDISVGFEDILTDEVEAIRRIEEKREFILPEVGTNIGIDLKYVYLFGYLVNINSTNLQERYHFEQNVVGLGLSVNIGKIFSENKQKQ